MNKVAVIMGSKSDLFVMQDAINQLEKFGVPYEAKVVSAHRTPLKMVQFAQEAEAQGFKAIIAGAGGAAHLPGMVASITCLPVIGVPISATKLEGMDSLMSIVQMPKGIPVATVAIDNATNAALLAIAMLATNDEPLLEKLKEYRKELQKQSSQGLQSISQEQENEPSIALS